MVKFFALVVDNGLALLAGALVALTIEHGWGWVLAQVKAAKAKQAAQVDALAAALKPIQDDIAAIKAKLPQ